MYGDNYNESLVDNFNIEKIEEKTIILALLHFDFNKVLASKALGMGRATLYRKAAKYGIAITRKQAAESNERRSL